jgi:transcriptional regulator with XRE-family HTH domain
MHIEDAMAKKPQSSADVRAIVGRSVHRLRKEAGLTQLAVADHCGMFRTYLSRIENGTANPTVTVLVDVATVLGVRVNQLFDERRRK